MSITTLQHRTKFDLSSSAVSESATLEAAAQAITATEGTIASVLGPAQTSVVSVNVVPSGMRLAAEKPEVGKQLFAALQEMLDAKTLVANPVTVVPGG